MLQAELCCRVSHFLRLLHVQRSWHSRLHITKRAGSRARIAHDQERGVPHRPDSRYSGRTLPGRPCAVRPRGQSCSFLRMPRDRAPFTRSRPAWQNRACPLDEPFGRWRRRARSLRVSSTTAMIASISTLRLRNFGCAHDNTIYVLSCIGGPSGGFMRQHLLATVSRWRLPDASAATCLGDHQGAARGESHQQVDRPVHRSDRRRRVATGEAHLTQFAPFFTANSASPRRAPRAGAHRLATIGMQSFVTGIEADLNWGRRQRRAQLPGGEFLHIIGSACNDSGTSRHQPFADTRLRHRWICAWQGRKYFDRRPSYLR